MVKHTAQWPVRDVGKTLVAFARIETDQKFMAQRKWREPSKPSKPQVACDHGLFSDEMDQPGLI